MPRPVACTYIAVATSEALYLSATTRQVSRIWTNAISGLRYRTVTITVPQQRYSSIQISVISIWQQTQNGAGIASRSSGKEQSTLCTLCERPNVPHEETIYI